MDHRTSLIVLSTIGQLKAEESLHNFDSTATFQLAVTSVSFSQLHELLIIMPESA